VLARGPVAVEGFVECLLFGHPFHAERIAFRRPGLRRRSGVGGRT
jgi:hypothetical protein